MFELAAEMGLISSGPLTLPTVLQRHSSVEHESARSTVLRVYGKISQSCELVNDALSAWAREGSILQFGLI